MALQDRQEQTFESLDPTLEYPTPTASTSDPDQRGSDALSPLSPSIFSGLNLDHEAVNQMTQALDQVDDNEVRHIAKALDRMISQEDSSSEDESGESSSSSASAVSERSSPLSDQKAPSSSAGKNTPSDGLAENINSMAIDGDSGLGPLVTIKVTSTTTKETKELTGRWLGKPPSASCAPGHPCFKDLVARNTGVATTNKILSNPDHPNRGVFLVDRDETTAPRNKNGEELVDIRVLIWLGKDNCDYVDALNPARAKKLQRIVKTDGWLWNLNRLVKKTFNPHDGHPFYFGTSEILVIYDYNNNDTRKSNAVLHEQRASEPSSPLPSSTPPRPEGSVSAPAVHPLTPLPSLQPPPKTKDTTTTAAAQRLLLDMFGDKAPLPSVSHAPTTKPRCPIVFTPGPDDESDDDESSSPLPVSSSAAVEDKVVHRPMATKTPSPPRKKVPATVSAAAASASAHVPLYEKKEDRKRSSSGEIKKVKKPKVEPKKDKAAMVVDDGEGEILYELEATLAPGTKSCRDAFFHLWMANASSVVECNIYSEYNGHFVRALLAGEQCRDAFIKFLTENVTTVTRVAFSEK